MQAAEILKIPLTEPERLFSGPAVIPAEFKVLAKKWHPDRGGDDKVFAHISALKGEAEKKAAAGVWDTPGLLEFRTARGTTLKVRYRKRHKFELGEVVVAPHTAGFIVAGRHQSLFENGNRRMSGPWAYPTPEIRAENEKYIPKILAVTPVLDHRVMMLSKTEDAILAKDLLEYLGGAMDPRHVAWVVSSLLNFCCLLDFNRMSHQGIAPDTVLISPQFHSAWPVGGWWYAKKFGEKVEFLPPFVARVASVVRKSKTADPRTDRDAVRALALYLLGDLSGSILRTSKTVPAPMLNYLRMPAPQSAADDYRVWSKKVLIDAFGPRKFVDLPVKGSDVYS